MFITYIYSFSFRWILDTSPNHKNFGNVKTGKVYVSHDVTNFEFLYEPFYVAKDIVPAHDERFMGYGYTRNTQVCILHFSVTLFHSFSVNNAGSM